MTSGALWITLFWVALIGSRPVSLWFGAERYLERPEDYLDGSPMDRNIFILLILAVLFVLWKRRIALRNAFVSNRWFFVFFLYCAISIIWSDYPFVSLKRWLKDFGTVGIVLIIATEVNPVQAARAIFARYSYLALALSVTLVKYFPDYGRYYNRWTYLPSYSGVTTNKNELGAAVCICGLFLVWELIEMLARRSAAAVPTVPGTDRSPGLRRFGAASKESEERSLPRRRVDRGDLLVRMIFLLTVIWLIIQAESSTAQTCLVLGTGLLLIMQLPIAKRQFRHLGKYTLALGFLALILYSVPEILTPFVEQMGKDLTLSGRTDLWEYLLNTPINPILGSGYQSFWLQSYAAELWAKYYFHPTQAHNGYIETYLQGGLLGLSLLLAMIAETGGKLKRELVQGDPYGSLRFTFLVVAIFYNWTEALFNKLSPVWIILLLAVLTCSREAMFFEKTSKNVNRSLLVVDPRRRISV